MSHYFNVFLVFISVMRSLGIPTRSITNYDSAHDTDNNLTFDKYFSEDGDYLDDESDDSCWYVVLQCKCNSSAI